jgi:hypothetical protein
MGPINEARIIEIVFLFLRERYKYYPLRSGNILLNRNLKGAGLLIVDGTITFPRSGEPDFLASIEATDYGKREELWFRFSWELAVWDAVAGSSGILCALFTWMHLSGHLGPFKGNPWLFGLAGLILLAFLSYLIFFLLRPLKRYRYIYAIEQFRRYAANEQWVAFAWDVFPAGNAPVFLELREQCVLNGLGMLEILRDGKVKMHLSPARGGMPGQQKRPIVQLFQGKEWPKNLQSQLLGNAWRRRSGALLQRLTGKKEINDLLRFERPVTVQAAVILASIALTFFLMWREYGKRPVIFEQEKRYERKMLAKKQDLEASKEDFIYPIMLDTAAVFKFDKNAKPYLELIPDTLPDWQNGSLGWITLEGGQIKSIPCEKVYSQLNGRYLVTAGMFFDLEYLKATMLRLRASGLPVQAVWGACFFERKNYYMLVFQETFDQAEPAQRAAVRINESLYGQGFPFNASFVKID